MMLSPTLYLGVSTLVFTVSHASGLLSASTFAGSVQGAVCKTSSATSFLSIPFAQPPTGNLRFQPPQPYNASYPGGTLNATIPAPSCIQFGDEFIEDNTQSENW